MMFRVNTLWWRSPLHRLQADAELARWIPRMLLEAPEASMPEANELADELAVLRGALNQGIGVRDWAALLGLHPRTLARRCRESTGLTPHQVLDQVRLQRAEVQLLQPEVPIPHIARNCGFATREAFSAWFSKCKGCAPVQWRNRVSKG
jgi:AraC-like DNA-binding protein